MALRGFAWSLNFRSPVQRGTCFKNPKYLKHAQNNLSLDDKIFETTLLFAAPPYVEYVTAVSADLDGTVYVSVDPNGSLGHIKGLGSVVTAKDTDGDGKNDNLLTLSQTFPKSARWPHSSRHFLSSSSSLPYILQRY